MGRSTCDRGQRKAEKPKHSECLHPPLQVKLFLHIEQCMLRTRNESHTSEHEAATTTEGRCEPARTSGTLQKHEAKAIRNKWNTKHCTPSQWHPPDGLVKIALQCGQRPVVWPCSNRRRLRANAGQSGTGSSRTNLHPLSEGVLGAGVLLLPALVGLARAWR